MHYPVSSARIAHKPVSGNAMRKPRAKRAPHIPEYHLTVGKHEMKLGPDSERGLFLLIQQNTGIDPVCARRMLKQGKMIIGNDLVVIRGDIFRDVIEKATQ